MGFSLGRKTRSSRPERAPVRIALVQLTRNTFAVIGSVTIRLPSVPCPPSSMLFQPETQSRRCGLSLSNRPVKRNLISKRTGIPFRLGSNLIPSNRRPASVLASFRRVKDNHSARPPSDLLHRVPFEIRHPTTRKRNRIRRGKNDENAPGITPKPAMVSITTVRIVFGNYYRLDNHTPIPRLKSETKPLVESAVEANSQMDFK